MNCYFKSKDNDFILGNNLIERTWRYRNGSLYTISILNKAMDSDIIKHNHKEGYHEGHQYNLQDDQKYDSKDGNIDYNTTPEFSYEGLTSSIRAKDKPYFMELVSVETKEVINSIYSARSLVVIFHLRDSARGVDIKRHAIIYDDIPTISTFIEVRTHNFPMGEFYNELKFNILDHYPITKNCDIKDSYSYEFFTRTDLTNHLVEEKRDPKGFDKGNILIYSSNKDSNNASSFFILKESPCFSDLRTEAQGNFYIDSDGIKTLGWGIRPEEFRINEYMKTYTSVIGVFQGDKTNGLLKLKEYTKAKSIFEHQKDCMVMANPWGDRHCLEHMGEEFVLKELEACAKLGATHYQLDDGWQKGEGLIKLSNNEALEEDYWDINIEKFPHMFFKIEKKAKELNIKLALWFAPDSNRLFRNYEQHVNLLYGMYKIYGIKQFKIDGVILRCKEAEENLEKLLATLKEKSNGEISFNLDTTNNPRAGYFMFEQYGNIFLENRYTDWGNYYPWRTLQNLWDLSAYVPAQKLQIEFLNIDRNKDKYKPEDILAPRNYSYDYVFAITMFANPLCWFEPSALGKEAMDRYRELISFHKKYRDEIFKGYIFPIGERPSGYSWTGFQSHNSDNNSGFIIVYREYNDKDVFKIQPLFMEGHNIELKNLLDDSQSRVIGSYDGEGISFCIDKQNSYCIYKYQLL